jgi:hypothetical protein
MHVKIIADFIMPILDRLLFCVNFVDTSRVEMLSDSLRLRWKAWFPITAPAEVEPGLNGRPK